MEHKRIRLSSRLLAVLLTAALVFGLTACGSGDSDKDKKDQEETRDAIGFVVGQGGLSDGSFNAQIWSAVEKAADDFDMEAVKKEGSKTAPDFTEAAEALCASGCKVVVLTGDSSADLVDLQKKYPETTFIMLDGDAAHWTTEQGPQLSENTVAVRFAEQETGFLAGAAAALTASPAGEEAQLAFVGGTELPSVKRYALGFGKGIAFANENYGTSCTLLPPVYTGSFEDAAGAEEIARSLFGQGVKVIFAANGAAESGIINAAIAQRKAGNDVWIVGGGTDHYKLGLYEDDSADTQHSVYLTSALKPVGQALYQQLLNWHEGEFQGGQEIVFGLSKGGSGLPENNPNFDANLAQRMVGLTEDLRSGMLVVSEFE